MTSGMGWNNKATHRAKNLAMLATLHIFLSASEAARLPILLRTEAARDGTLLPRNTSVTDRDVITACFIALGGYCGGALLAQMEIGSGAPALDFADSCAVNCFAVATLS